MERKNKITYGLAVAIFITAAAFTAWGVATHHEETFGRAERWESTPIGVWGNTYGYGHLSAADYGTLRAAVEAVNVRMGFEVYRMGPGSHTPVAVTLGAPVGDGADPGAHARVSLSEGRILSCEIQTRAMGTAVATELMLRHELGHCLGLTHDDFESSIMFPTVPIEVPMGQFPPRFTDDDRDAVRERYLRAQ